MWAIRVGSLRQLNDSYRNHFIVKNPARDFSATEEWFCWAAFERFMARRCGEVWLRSIANQFAGRVGELILGAAESYGRAFRFHDEYRSLLSAGEPSTRSLHERARTTRQIARITAPLEQGITAEAEGLDLLQQAVEAMPSE